MIAADAPMDVPKDVVPLFGNDTFDIRGSVTAFVEDVINDGVPCRSVSYLPCLVPVIWQDAVHKVREDVGHPSVIIAYDTHLEAYRARLSQDFDRDLPPDFIVKNQHVDRSN